MMKVGGGADDDDFDPMKSPAANSAFTPDSERIRPSTPLRSAFPRIALAFSLPVSPQHSPS
ncbi:hypothetical protein B0H13DRAFT_2342333 [Mycena leptocephala]|nr:hypothetical protein B0H13DRAFT_2342333 [Mycena leptocephala]